MVDLTARFVAEVVRTQPSDSVRGALAEALPWLAFLPDADVDQFMVELATVAQDAAPLTNPLPMTTVLVQWRHTAEVYADPVLLEVLSREPEGDLGPAAVGDDSW